MINNDNSAQPVVKVDETTENISDNENVTIELVSKQVNKVWADSNNQDGLRPGSIQVQLYKNGTAEGSAVTLNAANGWKSGWTGLAKKENGKTLRRTRCIC